MFYEVDDVRNLKIGQLDVSLGTEGLQREDEQDGSSKKAEPPKASKVLAFGDGLQKALVTTPARFTVDISAVGAPEKLKVQASGPGECAASYVDKKNGTFVYKYIAPRPGRYKIVVMYAGAHVRGSPFMVPVNVHDNL